MNIHFTFTFRLMRDFRLWNDFSIFKRISKPNLHNNSQMFTIWIAANESIPFMCHMRRHSWYALHKSRLKTPTKWNEQSEVECLSLRNLFYGKTSESTKISNCIKCVCEATEQNDDKVFFKLFRTFMHLQFQKSLTVQLRSKLCNRHISQQMYRHGDSSAN